ncbi:MAG: DAK2 domain-containing protein [Lachnospiraceae bacterium]
MAINTVSAETLAKMFLAGAANLESKKEWINELNVFPVPDGDTGTNMTMTIMSAAKEVSALEEVTMENLAKAISSGSLRGARGNSGVILSQLFRGFTKVVKKNAGQELSCEELAVAAQKAVETAYKAVMKPKEGTILTVAKGIAEKASELVLEGEQDVDIFMQKVIAHAQEVLDKTPEMLPVLKQAGVVDSGGQGLVVVLQGAYDGLLGKEISLDVAANERPSPMTLAGTAQAETEITFGYCTEFIIKLQAPFTNRQEQQFKAYLESIGDSIVCVAMDDLVKVHVHTNEPGNAIQKGLSYGELTAMKIDNMREEHNERLKLQEEQEEQKPVQTPRKNIGFVCVSVGAGLNEIFESLGVDVTIEGGQTMNPSTEDVLNAVNQVNADHVFILPNNKNIILAANQARDLSKDREVIVLPTTTVPQGIAAMIAFTEDLSAQENEAVMQEEIAHIKTGQITYAVRDTQIDGKNISKDDIMGIGDGSILAVGSDIERTAVDLIAELVDDSSELISIYYGEEITEDEAGALSEKIVQLYPKCDVELQYGGQPIYYYIISVE